MPKYGLGRLHAADERDRKHMMMAMLPAEVAVRTRKKYWSSIGWWGNQGDTPECVAYAWTHWLEDGPTPQVGKCPCQEPDDTYAKAQLIDEWAGQPHDGTTVRAGAKVLQDLGYIKEYKWAFDIETLKIALLTAGPVVVGTDWKTDMFTPNAEGLIKVNGKIEGGHAYKLDGIDLDKGLIRIKNSWGRDWGQRGFAFISLDDMAGLIEAKGEVCLAIEIKK